MSTGLMSCVRENSPPLEMARRESGAFSLPTNGAEPQKRRRFHPLRNLRRIFRRRTLTNVETPPSISSPSSPSSQLSLPPTIHASVPAHNLSSYFKSPSSTDIAPTPLTAYPPHLIELSNSRRVESCGIGIVPSFTSRTLHSDGYYTKDSVGTANDSVLKSKESSTKDLEGGREMSDCQRSFSEGRLVDSDFSREGLSQSHDSVFSESATASSLSIVLKAELFDALRKRRNRPDASDEDLGLPRSPITPLRKKQSTTNQSEISSISMLSLASLDRDDDMSSTSAGADRTNSSVSSSKMSTSFDSNKTSDEVDFILSSGARLSHSAAKHKMAIRPKKKGPTRIRRPVETGILPSTLEVNEDVLKYPLDDFLEKGKSNSLPSGVNANLLEKHSQDINLKDGAPHIKRSKTEGVTTLLGAHSVKDITMLSCRDKEFVDSKSTNTLLDRKDDKGIVIGRLQRNLKQYKYSGECDTSEDNNHINVIEKRNLDNNINEHSPKLEEFRKESQKLILSEGKSNLCLLSNSSLSSSPTETDSEFIQKIHKPKSGPAARQRILPMDLKTSPIFETKSNKSITAQFIQYESVAHAPTTDRTVKELSVDHKMNKMEYNEDHLYLPNKLSENVKNREQTSPLFTDEMLRPISSKSHTEDSQQKTEHFEKKEHPYPKYSGLSSVMQKVSRTTELVEDTEILSRNRKSVEKSKSFRYYSERHAYENEANLKSLPSLPDLTFSNKLCAGGMEKQEIRSKNPLEYQINDNYLIKNSHSEEQLPLTHGVHTKNTILAGSKPSVITEKNTTINTVCNQSITEIEENIDKLVKSPFLTGFKKSRSPVEKVDLKHSPKSCLSTRNRNLDSVEKIHKKDEKEKIVNTQELKEIEMNEKIKVDSSSKSKTMELIKSDAVMKKIEVGNKESSKALSFSRTRRNSSVVEKRADNQIPEFMKITLNRVDSTRPKSNIVLSKNIKQESELKDSRRYSNESVEITDNKPPLPSDLYSKANSLKIVDESTAAGKLNRKLDHENNILNMSEYNSGFCDKRKSITTDEKLKYDKKLVELKAEKKKIIDDSVTDPRKTSIDEETGVILRKKSFANSNQSGNGEDTPELMKVFARRSLKIKDDEFQYSYEELEKSNTLKKFNNLDSDKENQSSSEEKLEKLPKIEIAKQMNINENLCQKFDDKTRNSFIEFRKTGNSVSSSQSNSYTQPIRYSNIVGYKSVSAMYSKGTQLNICTLDQSSPSNLNETNNNTNTNNNNKLLGGIRHTIGGSSNHVTDQTEDNKFKGILQRRAEWEKRAKEALK